MKRILILSLTFLLCFSFFACNDTSQPHDIWENATYKENTTLGWGEKTVTVIVSAADKSVTFTLNTDEGNLGEALSKQSLVNNVNGLTDTVNGIKADYSTNGAWWKFCDENDNMLNYGIFDTEINGGEIFKLVYTIGF